MPVVPARSRRAGRKAPSSDRPTVGVLLQCVSDRVAPDIAVSAVRLLEAAGYKVEANAALRDSMESMSNRDRGAAVAKLKKARKRLEKAARAAPAAAQPAMMWQAAELDEVGAAAAGASFESEAGKEFVKSRRAASFKGQRR